MVKMKHHVNDQLLSGRRGGQRISMVDVKTLE
jgi:hypothetical protein